MATHSTLSEILGWLYFFCWGISNYPQFYDNWKRKSISGFSLDFYAWNQSGFIFYLIYTIVGSWQQSELDLPRTIVAQDIAFAANAVFIVSLIGMQVFIYRDTATTHLSRFHATGIIIMWVIAIYNVLLGLGGNLPWFSTKPSAYAYSVVQYLGFAKSFVSFIKYVPQVYLNYSRKCTTGWSIHNVLFDVGGGALSMAQMLVDAHHNGRVNAHGEFVWDWSFVTGNVPKLILAIESVAFDVIFIVQHYILYRHNNQLEQMKRDQAHEGLLDVSVNGLSDSQEGAVHYSLNL